MVSAVFCVDYFQRDPPASISKKQRKKKFKFLICVTKASRYLCDVLQNNFSSIYLIDQESDSGLEVVEEPTLRPSELVRGNNNRSLSMISGAI